MALGKAPAIASSQIASTSAIKTGAALKGGVRNLSNTAQETISNIANSIEANVDPNKAISPSQLETALKNSGSDILSSMSSALANFAPSETTQRDNAQDLKAIETRDKGSLQNKFAFGEGIYGSRKADKQAEELKQADQPWMNSGAALS